MTAWAFVVRVNDDSEMIQLESSVTDCLSKESILTGRAGLWVAGVGWGIYSISVLCQCKTILILEYQKMLPSGFSLIE